MNKKLPQFRKNKSLGHFIYQVDMLIPIEAKPFQRERDQVLKNKLKAIFGSLESSINDKYHLLKYDEILCVANIRKLYEAQTKSGRRLKRT